MGASRRTRPSEPEDRRLLPRVAVAALLWLLVVPRGAAAEVRLGGDARVYGFGRVDGEVGRRDAELGLLRLKAEGLLAPELSLEAHGVASLLSPAAPVTATIATGRTRRLFDLEETMVDERDLAVTLEVDRLNLVWQRPEFRLVVGRQAITWGVNVFWPALDLFAPFPPERIDREYKPGVDAIRLTVPLGPVSELDIVAAGQGSSIGDDGSLGALVRFHAGPADLGAMAGRFHRDTAAGVFVAADALGTGLRAELAFTDSGDPRDRRIDRSTFWRGGVGLDRQLTATVALTADVAWNGFGTTEPAEYRAIAAADRVRRGEVNSLGRYYAGLALTWQAHSLLILTAAALVNAGDGSVLLLPRAEWSLADNTSLVAGLVAGIGPGLDRTGQPGSEYGAGATVVYAALRTYF